MEIALASSQHVDLCSLSFGGTRPHMRQSTEKVTAEAASRPRGAASNPKEPTKLQWLRCSSVFPESRRAFAQGVSDPRRCGLDIDRLPFFAENTSEIMQWGSKQTAFPSKQSVQALFKAICARVVVSFRKSAYTRGPSRNLGKKQYTLMPNVV